MLPGPVSFNNNGSPMWTFVAGVPFLSVIASLMVLVGSVGFLISWVKSVGAGLKKN